MARLRNKMLGDTKGDFDDNVLPVVKNLSVFINNVEAIASGQVRPDKGFAGPSALGSLLDIAILQGLRGDKWPFSCRRSVHHGRRQSMARWVRKG
jgi:hypothetical protein